MTYISYIDPGTGSMLFSLFIGIAAALSFGLRAAFLKLKFIFSGGKATADETANTIPYVIYSDHKRYWNVFRPICDEFEQRQIPLVYYTSSEDDPALSADYQYIKAEFIGEGNKAFAKLNFLKADILLSTTPGLDVYQWKRSPDVKCYVHIPHTVDDLSGYRMFGLDYYDAVACSGDNQIRWIKKVESMRNIKSKDLTVCGSTYLDTMKNRKQSIKNTAKNEKPIILVAPSWGKSGILSKFGVSFIRAVLDTGYEVIIRPHPQTVVSEKSMLDELISAFADNQRLSWNYDNDNFEVLNRSDLLITDFSGIIFDYTMIFDKPLIYADTSFDTLPYDADWSDEQMWSLQMLPTLGFQLSESDFCNMKNRIDEALASSDLQAGRDEVRSDCWANIGNGAKNTVDYLISKRELLLSDKQNQKQGE